jgi:hypothetical protein
MNIFFSLANIASERYKNETGYDSYIKYARKVRVANIEESDSDGHLIVTTTPVIENRTILGDNWTEITFKFKYDYTTETAREMLEHQGYLEFEKRAISVADFLKIKYMNRKSGGAFSLNSESDHQAIGRLLDLEDYKDVQKIVNYYANKVHIYRNELSDFEFFQVFQNDEREKNDQNVRDMDIWENKLQDILDAMTSEDVSSEGDESLSDEMTGIKII